MSKTFKFGKNWQDFANKHLNQARIAEAHQAFLDFCDKRLFFIDKSFIDIGCGSGVHSLVAHKLGVASILSLDVDSDSVECTRQIKEKFAPSANWEIIEASILDDEKVRQLGQYDFVYSWGVLHHTGSMWKAIDNAASLVKPGGYFWLAIYNKADGWSFFPDGRFGNSKFWLIEKKIYNSLPVFLQSLIDFTAMSLLILVYLVTFKNPLTQIHRHQRFRGMSWAIDIRDWLGGYPYEYASVEEIFKYMKAKGFELQNIKTHNGLLNNEFLFKRNSL
jgi:2-polyprenyl-6-hydroxyphenyl methylase/3-demethylubiquinone-9 3-methyltransferase